MAETRITKENRVAIVEIALRLAIQESRKENIWGLGLCHLLIDATFQHLYNKDYYEMYSKNKSEFNEVWDELKGYIFHENNMLPVYKYKPVGCEPGSYWFSSRDICKRIKVLEKVLKEIKQ